MLIRRCAWHRSYRGYPLAFGIASWRGFRVWFTDGMCVGCATRLRREWNLPPIRTTVTAFGPGFGLVRAAVTVIMLITLILAARPLDDLRTPRLISVPPETVLVPPISVDEEPMPALAVAHVPRRARPAAPGAARILAPSRVVSAMAIPVAPASPAVLPPISASMAAARFPAVPTVFAALPHAGLTQQTP